MNRIDYFFEYCRLVFKKIKLYLWFRFKGLPQASILKESSLFKVNPRPDVYDLIWNYEQNILWFFTNLKAANEELETLFSKSFKLSLIRMFPYTAALLNGDLQGAQKDQLDKLSPTTFYRGSHA